MKYDFNNLDTIKENILVIYQGGGFDGCIWEWNYFIIKNNEFINLGSSGYHGINAKNEIVEKLENNTYDIYTLDNLDTFIKDYAGYNSYNVIKKINEMDIDYIEYPCSKCNTLHNINDITFFESDYHGNNPICSECYSENVCSYCGSEIDVNEHISIIDNENIGIYGCEWCMERQIEDSINGLIKHNKFIIGDKTSIHIKNQVEFLKVELNKIRI